MIVVIDFETTGLVKDGVTDFLAQPGICQIGAMKVAQVLDQYQIVGDFSSLVNPEMSKWEEGAMKVHGLTPEKVKDAPTFFEIFPGFADFCRGAIVWAGFNTKFDRDVLWYQLQRYGFERNFPWPPQEYDVMKMAAQRLNIQGKRGQKYPKLIDAYEAVFKRPYADAHDAFADVGATARLLMKWL